MAIRLIGRVIVNAAVENLRGGATFHTTFHQFLCNESGTGTAEVIIDGFTACGTVCSADDLNFQAIFLGDACHFVEIDELRPVEQPVSAKFKEEIDGRTYASLS